MIIIASRGSIGYVRGLVDEVGININRFEVRFSPEKDEKFENSDGLTVLRVMSASFGRVINVEGEIKTPSTGVMAFTLAVVCSLASTAPNMFQPSPGSIYLDEANITMIRGGWATVKVKCSSMALL